MSARGRKGVVLAVLDGSTIVVKFVKTEAEKSSDVDNSSEDIRAVSLDFILTPRLGAPNGSRSDESGAWQSFDFLRRLTIGHRINFIQTRTESEIMRSHPNFGRLKLIYGRVELIDRENLDVGMSIIDNGWGFVRKDRINNEYKDYLQEIEASSQEGGLGIWGPKDKLVIREISGTVDLQKIVDTENFQAVIEIVSNGSNFQLILLPNFETITLQLAGIRCPTAKHDPARGGSELFGPESKRFVERRFLQRTVNVHILGAVSKEGFRPFFFGEVTHSSVGSIGEFLLKEGLAEIFNPTLKYLSNPETLRRLEIVAKKEHKNMWRNLDLGIQTDIIRIEGIVRNIRGSGNLVVEVQKKEKNSNDNEHKNDDDQPEMEIIHLSSCKLPNYNPTGSSDALAFEAREVIRKLTIGQKVRCEIDYTIPSKETNQEMLFATVYTATKCVNVEIVRTGLSQVIISRNKASDEIEEMLKLEEKCKAEKIGVFQDTPPMPRKMNDLSGHTSREKSLEFLRNVLEKNVDGIIEFFPFASRCIVLIPSLSTVIRMNMMSIRAPDPNDRIGDEALKFCNDNYLMRDCSVFIRDVDKNGAFNGNLTIKSGGQSFFAEIEILKRGYADLRITSNRHPQKMALENALEYAQENKKGMWGDETKEVESLVPGETYECNVTAVWDPCTVVIQKQSAELKKINETIINAREKIKKRLMKGDLVAAIFEKKIYRGRIVSLQTKEKTVQVEFIDLCVNDYIPMDALRVLPKELRHIPPQALSVRLACCRPFDFSEDFNKEAEDFLWSLVEDQKLYAHLVVDDMSEPDPDILLTDSPDINSGNLNSMMLSKGYCEFNYIEVDRNDERNIITTLESIDLAVKKRKIGAWAEKSSTSNVEIH